MSEIDSGYEVTEVRSLGNDTVKVVIINSTTGDGFAIDIPNYSTIEDEDFDDILHDAVDSRLDLLERVYVDQAEKMSEDEMYKGRRGWKAKKTDTPTAPFISGPYPEDGYVGVPVTIDKLFFSVSDANIDLMDYTVTTSPNVGSASDTGVGNGKYTIPITGLLYSTVYTWTVTVDDGIEDPSVSVFTFTTEESE